MYSKKLECAADEHASITFHIHAFCPSEEEVLDIVCSIHGTLCECLKKFLIAENFLSLSLSRLSDTGDDGSRTELDFAMCVL